jgi:accessory gene regulator B
MIIKTIAEELSLALVSNRIIEIEDRKNYIYGIELVLYDIFIFVTIAVIAVLTDKVQMSLIFTFLFCTVRAYAGGYHCNTYAKCFFTALTVYLFMLVLNAWLGSKTVILACILLVVSVPIILRFAPVEHENNPLSHDEKNKYRKYSMRIVSVSSALFILSLIYFAKEISFAISWAIFATAVFIVVSKLVLNIRKGG